MSGQFILVNRQKISTAKHATPSLPAYPHCSIGVDVKADTEWHNQRTVHDEQRHEQVPRKLLPRQRVDETAWHTRMKVIFHGQ